MKKSMLAAMNAKQAAENRAQQPVAPVKDDQMTGNYSRMAMNEMERTLRESREMHSVMKGTLIDGILNGRIPVEIPPAQIEDVVGTDRILNTEDDIDDSDGFDALVENIRSRGLRVPLRVRPKDAFWRPSDENPRDVGASEFILQSGRRRLAACKKLGITPMAFVSHAEGDARFSDLQERFFENASRKNLTLIEKLYSVGLLAKDLESMTQNDIAKLLGVGQAYVSRGIAIVDNFDRLSREVDLSNLSARELDDILSAYRSETASPQVAAQSSPRKTRPKVVAQLPFDKRKLGKTTASLKMNSAGVRVLALKSQNLTDDVIDRILKIIEEQENKTAE